VVLARDYFYGPVYSRRLGLSLGVDILPGKICSFGCVYCQLGKTDQTTLKRFVCADTRELKRQLRIILASKPKIDYITISGSGEPTLHKKLDKIIAAINAVTGHKYPICVITNSSLLWDKAVRKELMKADLVVPSLDASSEAMFQKIDKPDKNLSFDQVLQGLIQFRHEFKNEFWLEIMLVKGINDNEKAFLEFRELVKKINPDKVHINLPERPAPHANVELMPGDAKVKEFKKILGSVAVVVVSPGSSRGEKHQGDFKDMILVSLKRRPQTIDDLSCGLQLDYPSLKRALSKLIKTKEIRENKQGKKSYFVAV
jgi:wyosine [tRNA(Phe)-imidazoG37] synthetase (radical SAM superfamily)